MYWPWNALITCCLELGVVKSCSVSHRTCFFTLPSCSSHGYLWFNCLTKVFLPLQMKDLASELFFWQSALWKRVVAVFAGIDMARSHIPGKSLGDAVGILHLLCSPQEESPSRAQSQGRRLVSGAWLVPQLPQSGTGNLQGSQSLIPTSETPASCSALASTCTSLAFPLLHLYSFS